MVLQPLSFRLYLPSRKLSLFEDNTDGDIATNVCIKWMCEGYGGYTHWYLPLITCTEYVLASDTARGSNTTWKCHSEASTYNDMLPVPSLVNTPTTVAG